jgi:Arc/MetJ-type ribon-helix-helix transcriptional regulator
MSMVSGMATRKITITLDELQVEAVKQLVVAGRASSVSGFVQHAVSIALDDVAAWAAMIGRALDETGGPLTDMERAWADEMLGTSAARQAVA